jgi:hypothetical protein
MPAEIQGRVHSHHEPFDRLRVRRKIAQHDNRITVLDATHLLILIPSEVEGLVMEVPSLRARS